VSEQLQQEAGSPAEKCGLVIKKERCMHSDRPSFVRGDVAISVGEKYSTLMLEPR
jgi:hypothetical protein